MRWDAVVETGPGPGSAQSERAVAQLPNAQRFSYLFFRSRFFTSFRALSLSPLSSPRPLLDAGGVRQQHSGYSLISTSREVERFACSIRHEPAAKATHSPTTTTTTTEIGPTSVGLGKGTHTHTHWWHTVPPLFASFRRQ